MKNVQNLITAGILGAMLLWCLQYGLKQRELNECAYWEDAGYQLTEPMQAQCDYLLK